MVAGIDVAVSTLPTDLPVGFDPGLTWFVDGANEKATTIGPGETLFLRANSLPDKSTP